MCFCAVLLNVLFFVFLSNKNKTLSIKKRNFLHCGVQWPLTPFSQGNGVRHTRGSRRLSREWMNTGKKSSKALVPVTCARLLHHPQWPGQFLLPLLLMRSPPRLLRDKGGSAASLDHLSAAQLARGIYHLLPRI